MGAETREGGFRLPLFSGPPFSLRPERLLMGRFIRLRAVFASLPTPYCGSETAAQSVSLLSLSEYALQFDWA